jgi:glycerol-3-phosphate dehydrogenase
MTDTRPRPVDRAAMVRRLAREAFDVLVVGGGITGAWIARDAALRGLTVGLVEKGDFASGTSSRSSRLVHGGLRYLQHRHISLVREALRERGLLLGLAPHLVRPIPFLIPVYDGDPTGPLLLRLGLTGYDILAGSRRIGRHRARSRRDLETEEPALQQDRLRTGFRYYDAITNDARLTLAVVTAAIEDGAAVANYVEVVSWDTSGRRIAAVNCRDAMTGEELTATARSVALAAGPWTDEMRALSGAPAVLRPTKGIHVVVPREKLRTSSVVAFFWERRPYFAVPAGNHTYIGTTDTDWRGDASGAIADARDVQEVLDAVNGNFSARIEPADVTATWAGIRPLVAEEGSPAPSDVSRDYEILEGPPGVYAICGGKLTSARAMAEAVVDRIAEKELAQLSVTPGACRTMRKRLPGGVGGFDGYRRDAVAGLVGKRGVSPGPAERVVNMYGNRYAGVVADSRGLEPLHPASPALRAEATYAATHEMAQTLEDFMQRRSDLMLFGPDAGGEIAAEAAAALGRSLGWNAGRIRRELNAYTAATKAMTSFRAPSAAPAAGCT